MVFAEARERLLETLEALRAAKVGTGGGIAGGDVAFEGQLGKAPAASGGVEDQVLGDGRKPAGEGGVAAPLDLVEGLLRPGFLRSYLDFS